MLACIHGSYGLWLSFFSKTGCVYRCQPIRQAMQHIGGFEHSAGFKLTNEPGNLRTNHAEGIVALPCQHCSCRFELKAGKERRKKKNYKYWCVHWNSYWSWCPMGRGTGWNWSKNPKITWICNDFQWDNMRKYQISPYMTIYDQRLRKGWGSMTSCWCLRTSKSGASRLVEVLGPTDGNEFQAEPLFFASMKSIVMA